MNVNAHYRPHPMIQRAQANARAAEIVDKFFRFAERKQRDFENGRITKAEYDEFRSTPPSEYIRNYGLTWAE